MKSLLERVQNGEIDPSFVVTHRAALEDAPMMYQKFLNKEDECIKVVLKPAASRSELHANGNGRQNGGI